MFHTRVGGVRTWVLLCVCLTLGLALNGCSDEPTQANSLVAALPFSELVVRDTTISATAGLSFRQYTVMDGRVNLIGRYGGYTAYTLIEFYPSYFASRDTALVYSAKLTLTVVTSLGSAGAPFGFNVYRLDRSWSETSFTWDSLQSGLYDPSVIRGSFTSVAAGPDTQQIVVNLDTAMVRDWLATPTSTTATKYGIILVPTPSTNIVLGIHEFATDSASYYPSLQIIAGNTSGTARDTMVPYNQGIDTFVGNIDNLAADPTLLYMQAGVAYRSALTFDVSFIPKGSIVNSAELLLDRKPGTSMLTRFTADTVLSPHVLLSGTDNSVFESELTSAYGRRKAGTPYTFSLDMRHAVQSWVRGPNYGVLLRQTSGYEYSCFDLLTFYGPLAADPAARPRLKVIYSQKKIQ